MPIDGAIDSTVSAYVNDIVVAVYLIHLAIMTTKIISFKFFILSLAPVDFIKT